MRLVACSSRRCGTLAACGWVVGCSDGAPDDSLGFDGVAAVGAVVGGGDDGCVVVVADLDTFE